MATQAMKVATMPSTRGWWIVTLLQDVDGRWEIYAKQAGHLVTDTLVQRDGILRPNAQTAWYPAR